MEKKHSNFKDIIGQKFGKLTAIKFLFTKKTGKSGKNAYWGCVCSCGNFHIASGYGLRYGQVTSCGCAYRDMGLRMIKPNNAHSKNTLYNLYIQRCKKRKINLMSKNDLLNIVINPCYYCNLDYSINKKQKHTEFKCNGLDRIDNNEGYELNNVLPCCQYCNAIRMDVLTIQETKKVIELLKKERNTHLSPWIEQRNKDLKI